ncbi:MAG: TrkA C-terminal domain-containing protein [Vulcanimicrobiota bacterium]
MFALLLQNPTLRLFVVIGAGYILGSIRIGGFSLGVAAVLFAGLALGAWGPGQFDLPPLISTLGLALFVYTMGLACGPAAPASLRRHGLRMAALVCGSLLLSALLCIVVGRWLGLPAQQAAGVYCGAITNTPALAAQLEWLQRNASDAPQAVKVAPAVGYSLAYPFGVAGLLLLMAFYSRRLQPAKKPEWPVAVTYRITEHKPNGNFLEADWVQEVTGLVVSRRLRAGHQQVVLADTVLEPEDLVAVVGTPEQHKLHGSRLGCPVDVHLEQQGQEVQFRRYFLSRRELVGKHLKELPALGLGAAVVTRVRRGDLEITADPELRLEWGDVLRVVVPADCDLGPLFGDSLDSLAHTDLFPMALGMVLGVLLGSLPLPLGAPPYPTLGVAGGTLVVGLLLGYMGRTGPLVWTMPLEANLALRQIGLLFFLAPIGIMAGGQFASAMEHEGLRLILLGALLTSFSSLSLLLLGIAWLKLPPAELLGLLSGAHTQPAALAYASDRSRDPAVEISYAAVFPLAMISKILLATWLLTV